MDTTTENVFSEEESDILQEVMNISFGKASADLTEVINAYVILSVPEVTLIKADKLSDYVGSEIESYSGISVVEQNFLGQFKGSAFLIFPSLAGKKLLTILDHEKEPDLEEENINLLEQEALIEVGNILIGACIGKIAELLNEYVTYSPPRIIFEKSADKYAFDSVANPEDLAIIMKTVFCFEETDVNGFLFLKTSQESFHWLKNALYKFLEQYE